MFIKQFFYTFIGLFLLNQGYAEPPFETLRSCIDLKPKSSSIKITSLEDDGVAEVNENNCYGQYDRKFNGHLYGTVTCNDVFYLIINGKKIKLDNAINKSVNPEIKPGLPFSIRALWNKIDQNGESYLCIEDSLSESGVGAAHNQYYIIENAFEENSVPIIYYYFFYKDIIPITSEHF